MWKLTNSRHKTNALSDSALSIVAGGVIHCEHLLQNGEVSAIRPTCRRSSGMQR